TREARYVRRSHQSPDHRPPNHSRMVAIRHTFRQETRLIDQLPVAPGARMTKAFRRQSPRTASAQALERLVTGEGPIECLFHAHPVRLANRSNANVSPALHHFAGRRGSAPIRQVEHHVDRFRSRRKKRLAVEILVLVRRMPRQPFPLPPSQGQPNLSKPAPIWRFIWHITPRKSSLHHRQPRPPPPL